MYKSIFDSLLHSFIVYGKIEFLKISVLHSAADFVLYAQNFARATEKNVVPKFTNRLSITLCNICKE